MPLSHEHPDTDSSHRRVYDKDPAQQAGELVEAWHRAVAIAHGRPDDLNGMRGVIRKFLVDQQERFGTTAEHTGWFQTLVRLIEETRTTQP